MSNHWNGLIALIVAIGVSLSVVILAISELDHGTAGHISPEETTLLATILGAGIGAIATYLGAHERERGGAETPPPTFVTRYPPRDPYDQDDTAEMVPPKEFGPGLPES